MNFARIWCITNQTPARQVTPPWTFTWQNLTQAERVTRSGRRATRLGGSPHLSCKRDQIKMRDHMDRRVTPPKRLTSPTWGPPPPCKQALRKTSIQSYEIPQNRPFSIPFLTLMAFHRVKKSQLIIEIVDRIKIRETPSLILEHLAVTKFSVITFSFLERWLQNFAKNHSAIVRNILISLMVNIFGEISA